LAAERVKAPDAQDLALVAKDLLAKVYRSRGELDREKGLRLARVEGVRRDPNPNPTALAGALQELGQCLVRRREFVDAEPVLRESVSRWQAFDPTCFDVFRAKHQLGLALNAQKKYPEAERALLDAYTGAKTHTAPKAPNIARHFLPLFLESLIDHYKET